MKNRPILFSGSMVRAIREGRKTQTRRIVKTDGLDCSGPCGNCDNGGVVFCGRDWAGNSVLLECPYGNPGDRLWVRETWRMDAYNIAAEYRASTSALMEYIAPWRPSIHMPRWASRITLEIVSVRVERLQDISEDDAKAEGVEPYAPDDGRYVAGFKGLWESIHRPGSWDRNDWVWVIEFKEAKP